MSATKDVVVMGGGLAGLTLALQTLQKVPHAKVSVLEKRVHPVPEAAFKVGESTVEVGAHYFGRVLGFREHILESQLPKLGLRFFFPSGDNRQIDQRLELGGKRFAPCPSYQIDRGRFENYLAEQCVERGIELIGGAKIQSFEMGRKGSAHQVQYAVDGEAQSISGKWLIDASGRRAFLKRGLNLQKDSPHTANAAWFRFGKHIKIDEWSSDSEWGRGHEGKLGRWFSTNHLMGQGYWVWLIPLASGSTSMGIVAAEKYHSLSDFNSMKKAIAWLEKHEPQCADAVNNHLDDLQDFRAIKHYATESKQVFSKDRWGITGEAGFFHDPFYSPGSDFIAFANTFLSDLIERDLNGKSFRMRAFSYDRIFKRFYYGTITAYQDQYQMFGNPQVMPVKILWDYLMYWSITGFIFMQDRMCEQSIYVQNIRRLSRLGKLNHFMQDLFRKWHQATEHEHSQGLVDISQIPLVREMNQSLLEQRNRSEFVKQFSHNLQQLEVLAAEILAHSNLDLTFPFRTGNKSSIRKEAFASVFDATAPIDDSPAPVPVEFDLAQSS